MTLAPCGISIPRPSCALLSSVVVEGLCRLISRKDTSRRGNYETVTRVVKRGREPHWEIFMRRFSLLAAVAAILAMAVVLPAEAGCYRVGETGYHWYRYCVGPHFLYPHHRVCRHGHCWYH